jgi:hypothetical protein
MQHQRRLSERVATALPIDEVSLSDVEHALREWFDLWIQRTHPGDPTGLPLAVHSLSAFEGGRVFAAHRSETA